MDSLHLDFPFRAPTRPRQTAWTGWPVAKTSATGGYRNSRRREAFDDWVDNLYGFVHIINSTIHALQSSQILHALAYGEENEGSDSETNYAAVPRTETATKADEKLQQAHSWLTNFERPEHLADRDYEALVRFATGFFNDEGTLWKRDAQ